MRKYILILSLMTLIVSACGGSSSTKSTTATSTGNGQPTSTGNGQPAGTHMLMGTFKVTSGTCSSSTAAPTGSYLQILGNGGAVVKNSFGGCANPGYTPLKPGTKGLTTGSYEPNPTPAFMGTNALADAIVQPANFFGSNFALSTQAMDPQTKAATPAPSLMSNAGHLTGNLSAMDIAYNTAYFNQGSPKPDGTYPGTTKAATGDISCTGDYTLSWQSLIIGGAFNNYTGVWHLTGTFVPSSGSVAQALGC